MRGRSREGSIMWVDGLCEPGSISCQLSVCALKANLACYPRTAGRDTAMAVRQQGMNTYVRRSVFRTFLTSLRSDYIQSGCLHSGLSAHASSCCLVSHCWLGTHALQQAAYMWHYSITAWTGYKGLMGSIESHYYIYNSTVSRFQTGNHKFSVLISQLARSDGGGMAAGRATESSSC